MRIKNLLKKIILNTSRSRQERAFFENNFYKNIYLETRDGVKIGVSLFLPPQVDQETSSVLILHGVGCNRDDVSELGQVKYFSRRNVLVLIPDYREFGDSEGMFDIRKVNLDILACFEFLQKEYRIFKTSIIGFSLGTGIASEYVRYINKLDIPSTDKEFIVNPFMPDKIILISPFCSLKDLLNSFRLFRISSFLIPYLKRVVEEEFDYDTLSNLEYIEKEKIFLFHGIFDTLIPQEESLRIQKKFGCYFKSIQSDHIRILLNEELWEEIDRILK